MEKVIIHMKSTINQEGKTVIKNRYEGELYCKQGSYYIRYNDEHAGRTTVKLSDDNETVSVLWPQHLMKKIQFKKDTITETIYQLPQQNLLLTVKTTDLKIHCENEKLRTLKINYTLFQEDMLFGKYQIQYKLSYMK